MMDLLDGSTCGRGAIMSPKWVIAIGYLGFAK